ncbi:HopJ type III effector protein [Vibrio sp. SCSIO 43136]|uniref:HopJ type III effector protein n=1 Tax=Vibrio sp. SCSIO 43136 TaxID=2819101 RepID=UPI0020761F18|nr:HopJ type III effector protein [Vibrio sp. SCSIO 43136]USD66935.1 HopJ type III effector protein [Vibrio sp. SCSIO 43136]
MELDKFLSQLTSEPSSIEFEQTMASIDANYEFTPTAFANGETHNQANQNNGSCKIFAFASKHQLSVEHTLHCFGKFYRQDVLENPSNDDHQNIRNFMVTGWDGIQFEGEALSAR